MAKRYLGTAWALAALGAVAMTAQTSEPWKNKSLGSDARAKRSCVP